MGFLSRNEVCRCQPLGIVYFPFNCVISSRNNGEIFMGGGSRLGESCVDGRAWRHEIVR